MSAKRNTTEGRGETRDVLTNLARDTFKTTEGIFSSGYTRANSDKYGVRKNISRFAPTKRGFTLIEMLVTIAIFGSVMVITSNLLLTIFSNSTTSPNALNAVDQAEGATSNFVNQIRDAAYGNDGSSPLGEASTTEIIFFSPYGSSGSTTVDRIRYFLASSTLYEGITVPSGSPASYNLANEKVSAILPHVSGNGTSTVFFYYGGTYAGTSSPLSQPVNVNQVTYVGMTLAVQLQEVIGATTTSVISTGATIRNLKTNLGN